MQSAGACVSKVVIYPPSGGLPVAIKSTKRLREVGSRVNDERKLLTRLLARRKFHVLIV